MQYPPQPPASKPYYAPTEIYLAELPLTNEATQEATSEQKIVVYANRIRAARSLTVRTNRMILIGVSIILSIILMVSYTNNSPQANPALLSTLAIIILAYIVIAASIATNLWVTRRSLLVNPAPLLLINSAGITMRGALSLSDIFIAWSEIESLDIYTYKYQYLCIRPRNKTLFMKRIPLLERLLKLYNSLYGMPPLYISLVYLDKPVEEILQQVYHMYAKELSYYRVQIRS